MVAKITEQSRQKPVYVYVRQSTLRQVRHHQPSTQRQYALRNRAQELGWLDEAIRTLDRDLERSNLDQHQLLCAFTHTLVVDEDGIHDPGDFIDGLLLGLKGTMAQAELHLLRARLQGGKLNKARRGELHFPLPVGLCGDDQGRIVPDPDDEVRGAVARVTTISVGEVSEIR